MVLLPHGVKLYTRWRQKRETRKILQIDLSTESSRLYQAVGFVFFCATVFPASSFPRALTRPMSYFQSLNKSAETEWQFL